MISIRGLSKQFIVPGGQVKALKGLDLDVGEGEFYVIVGPSGSGKTTLLRCVAGLERPDGGEIRIADRLVTSDSPPTWVPPQERHFGMVFQSYAVWPHLTVEENVALPLKEGTQRIPRSQVRQRVHEALRLVQLEEQADRSATLLSGGQQQRVALARAIAVNPKVLLMDEPLSNLDARLREEVRGKIRQLAKQIGATVLYVTHDQVEAMAIGDRIALMGLGELLQSGAPMDLYRNPRLPQVAEFFGLVNWLRGKAIENHAVETTVGTIQIESAADPGAQVLLGFRPECLLAAETPAGRGRNTLQARLLSSTFVGDQFIYEVAVGERSLVGKSRAMSVRGDGQMRLYVDPSDIMVFPAAAEIGLADFSAASSGIPLAS